LRCTLPRLSTGLAYCGVFLYTLIPQDFFASSEDAQSQPFGPGPGLRAWPANFLRNHRIFVLFKSSSKGSVAEKKGEFKQGKGLLSASVSP
jgi:hypothetical protein